MLQEKIFDGTKQWRHDWYEQSCLLQRKPQKQTRSKLKGEFIKMVDKHWKRFGKIRESIEYYPDKYSWVLSFYTLLKHKTYC